MSTRLEGRIRVPGIEGGSMSTRLEGRIRVPGI
jgi:hypothetical protein